MTAEVEAYNKKSSRLAWIRRLKALFIKEFIQILRDPSSLLVSIILPLILLFIYGFGVSLDLNHLRIGLVLEDTSPTAISLAKSFTDSPYFDVTLRRDRRELYEDILSGRIRGMVVIPSYFSGNRYISSTTAPIQVITDGSEPNTASFVQNYVASAWQNWLVHESISKQLPVLSLITIQPRFWYNEQLESRNFLIPGSLAIIMALIGTLLTALVVSREWERGTMEALMSTPVTILELIVAKLIPYFFLAMLSMTLCVVTTHLLFQIPFRGSVFALAFVTMCFLWPALGLGLFISTVSRNQFVAAQASIVTAFLPAYILSGFIFEIASMPAPIRLLTYLMAPRYFVTSLQTLFLAGDIWPLLIRNIIPMLIIGLFFFVVTAKITVKRLD